MIDQDKIKLIVSEKYKSVYDQDVTSEGAIQTLPDDFFGSGDDPDCVARAISYASTLIEIDRLEDGIKKSAKTTADCCDSPSSEPIVDAFPKKIEKLLIGYGSDAPRADDRQDTSNFFDVFTYIGLITGPESDFYGLNWGASAGYRFCLGNNFSLGPEIGYSRFTGKETDFGFESEGVGFIPVKARGTLDFLDDFFVTTGLGYALGASEENDGGIAFDLGVGLDLTDLLRLISSDALRVEVSTGYNSIQVNGGSFNSIFGGARLRF